MTVSLLQAFARMKSSACEEERGLVRTGTSRSPLGLAMLVVASLEASAGLWVVQELPRVRLEGNHATPSSGMTAVEQGPGTGGCLAMLGGSGREQ